MRRDHTITSESSKRNGMNDNRVVRREEELSKGRARGVDAARPSAKT